MAAVAVHDYLLLGADATLPSVLHGSASGDAPAESIYYSDFVTKFNRHNSPQERVLLTTSAAFYNLDRSKGNKLRLKRRVPLALVEAVTTSHSSTEFVLHVPSEYDYRLATPSKAAALDAIDRARAAAGLSPLERRAAPDASLEAYTRVRTVGQGGGARSLRDMLRATLSLSPPSSAPPSPFLGAADGREQGRARGISFGSLFSAGSSRTGGGASGSGGVEASRTTMPAARPQAASASPYLTASPTMPPRLTPTLISSPPLPPPPQPTRTPAASAPSALPTAPPPLFFIEELSAAGSTTEVKWRLSDVRTTGVAMPTRLPQTKVPVISAADKPVTAVATTSSDVAPTIVSDSLRRDRLRTALNSASVASDAASGAERLRAPLTISASPFKVGGNPGAEQARAPVAASAAPVKAASHRTDERPRAPLIFPPSSISADANPVEERQRVPLTISATPISAAVTNSAAVDCSLSNAGGLVRPPSGSSGSLPMPTPGQQAPGLSGSGRKLVLALTPPETPLAVSPPDTPLPEACDAAPVAPLKSSASEKALPSSVVPRAGIGAALRAVTESVKEPESSDEGGATPHAAGSGGSRSLCLADFDLVRVIGKGSYGKVLLVKLAHGRWADEGPLAMKVLSKAHVVARRQVEHTQAERVILEAVDHPFLQRLRFAFQSRTALFLVTRFLPGGELFHHLRNAGRFSEELTRFYAAEVALALHHLHSLDIVYRDLKPENILLDSDGHVKLTDFGLSKVLTAEHDRTSTFCGTPEYLAPEMIEGRPHGKAIDMWALGVLIWEMLAGAPPWSHGNTQVLYQYILAARLHFLPHFSPAACALLSVLLEREPAARIGSLADLKRNAFFDGVDWDALLSKTAVPPWAPAVQSSDDVANFEDFTEKDGNLGSSGAHGTAGVGSLPLDESVIAAAMSSAAGDASGLFEGFSYHPSSGVLAGGIAGSVTGSGGGPDSGSFHVGGSGVLAAVGSLDSHPQFIAGGEASEGMTDAISQH